MAQAIFRALDAVKREDWFQQTQVYLYRGAWQVLSSQLRPALCKGLSVLTIHSVILVDAAPMQRHCCPDALYSTGMGALRG